MMAEFVALKSDPKVIGKVLRRGEYVSEVRFKAEPYSHFQYYDNDRLVLADDDNAGLPANAPVGVLREEKVKIDYSKARIVIKVDGNPRSPTAKAFTKWKEMKAYVMSHPRASIKDVAGATSYKVGDFRWDLERGNVGWEAL